MVEFTKLNLADINESTSIFLACAMLVWACGIALRIYRGNL